MKKWQWRKILIGVAVFLVVLGIAPLAYLLWFGSAHNFTPLSVPISLKRGEFISPFFTTDLDEGYQVEIYFLPSPRTPLDLDWKIVDEAGTVIKSGKYTDDQYLGDRQLLGNDAVLERQFQPKRGSRQRVIVSIHQDVVTPDAERRLRSTDTRLYVGLPERGLEQAFGVGVYSVWAAVVAGAGALILLVLLALRVFRRQTEHVRHGGPDPQ
jgi:hypothetical protein